MIRALEVWYETGETISAHNAATRLLPPRYDGAEAGAELTKTAPTSMRASTHGWTEMAASGLADEVRALLESGVSSGCTAMQAIGYKELCAAVRGRRRPGRRRWTEVKLRSRQYAKRQLTWFRRDRTSPVVPPRQPTRSGSASTLCGRKTGRSWNTMTRGLSGSACP